MIDTPPAIIVHDDRGGLVGDYLQRVTRYRNGGLRVVIEGECASACTLLLSVPNHCVGPRARLGFHSPSMAPGRDDPTGAIQRAHATLMFESYPPLVRAWLASQGGLTSQIVYLSGGPLKALVKACPP